MAAQRQEWLDLARELDWEPSYVDPRALFPESISGKPWLPGDAWAGWSEPYRTAYHEYVRIQSEKDTVVTAVCDLLRGAQTLGNLDPGWLAGVKLHSASLPLAEFAAVVGNMRAARFARAAAWRTSSAYGGLDELRHTQIPLLLMHQLIPHDAQFDWTHKLYHSNCWVAIAARHAFDEMLLCANPIEFAVATNFVFETGFTNLQFIGLSALSQHIGDHLFEAMITSIQTDEARHAQIGRPVLEVVLAHDPEYAQYLIDKWFWRSWLLFAIVTGFVMDYLTPLEHRRASFKEFVTEWVTEQYLSSLEELGLKRPWYWDIFQHSLDHYHHMVYASAYSYRASVWFDFVLPGPEERAWLRSKYPNSWDKFEPVWDTISERWRHTNPGVEFAVHGTAIPTFCSLCQLVLSHGEPGHNHASVLDHQGQRYVFCSEPCRWIFQQETERYDQVEDVVKRVLSGKAPGNLLEFLTRYCGLQYETWGKDAFAGDYPWLSRKA